MPGRVLAAQRRLAFAVVGVVRRSLACRRSCPSLRLRQPQRRLERFGRLGRCASAAAAPAPSLSAAAASSAARFALVRHRGIGAPDARLPASAAGASVVWAPRLRPLRSCAQLRRRAPAPAAAGLRAARARRRYAMRLAEQIDGHGAVARPPSRDRRRPRPPRSRACGPRADRRRSARTARPDCPCAAGAAARRRPRPRGRASPLGAFAAAFALAATAALALAGLAARGFSAALACRFAFGLALAASPDRRPHRRRGSTLRARRAASAARASRGARRSPRSRCGALARRSARVGRVGSTGAWSRG